LIISPRIAYTRHAVKGFNVNSYLDGDCDLPKLACSMESLSKIPDTRLYEYVILDEVERKLSIFFSVTIQGKQLNVFNKSKRIIGNSKKTIVAGAFTTQKTIDFVESFNTKTLLIRNDRITTRKNAIEIDPNGFDEQLSIKDNKPHVYFDTKKDALTFISKLKLVFGIRRMYCLKVSYLFKSKYSSFDLDINVSPVILYPSMKSSGVSSVIDLSNVPLGFFFSTDFFI
jgi:Origin of replication binding protein